MVRAIFIRVSTSKVEKIMNVKNTPLRQDETKVLGG